jgi:multiple sugar transport system substrate-binding protein
MRIKRAAVIPLAAVMLAACGGDDADDSSGGGVDTPDDVSLTLHHDKPPWEANFDRLGEAGLAATGTELEQVPYSDGDAFRAFVRQSFATDERPDLFTWWVGGELQDLVEEGVIAPTTHLWDEAIAAGNVAEDLADSFTFDGEQYCVPSLASPWIMYYSTSVFDAHGLTPPTTWAEMVEIVDTLRGADVWPILAQSGPFSPVWFMALLAGADPELYGALSITEGTASFTDQGVVDVMDTWLDQIENGWFTPPGTYTDSAGAASMMLNGEAGMIYFGSWFNGILAGNGMVPGEDFGVFLLPNINPDLDQTSVIVEPGPICSAADAPNLEAAEDYLRWWMGPEAQQLWVSERGDISFNPQTDVPDEGLGTLNDELATGNYRQILRFAESAPAPVTVAANDVFDGFIANPGDPMPFLEQIQAENERYWADR